MKDEIQILFVSLIFGILFWILEAAIDTLLFYEGRFLDLLIFDIPSHELYIRLLMLTCFIGFGIICSRVVAHRNRIGNRLDRLNRLLSAIRNVNQKIFQKKSRKELLNEICKSLIATKGYYNVWIGLVRNDRPMEIYFNAGFDRNLPPLKEWPDDGSQLNCCRQVFDRGEMVVIKDPFESCPQCPLSSNYKGRAALSAPLKRNGKIFGCLTVSVPKHAASDAEEQVLFTELAGDIAYAISSLEAEKRRDETELKYAKVINGTKAAVLATDKDGKITFFNAGAEVLFECTANTALGLHVSHFCPDDLIEEQTAVLQEVIQNGKTRAYETERISSDGLRKWVEISISPNNDSDGRIMGMFAILRDISERKQIESERELTIDLLKTLSSPSKLQKLLADMTKMMRSWSGCEAVGIRLKRGDDYPYFETRGFPEKFIQAEKHLCVVNAQGEIIRDQQGTPVLECMCGNVLRGRFDADLPFFTENGSFWTNSTSQLLASTSNEERQARTRNRCNSQGYESVALIPLRYGEKTLGLLQFNDPRPNRFDENRIAFLEQLGASLALGLSQRLAELELLNREASYRALMAGMPDIIIRFDKEFRHLYVSENVENVVDMPANRLIGKTHQELGFPDDLCSYWETSIQKVFDTGEPFQKEFSYQKNQDENIIFNWRLQPEYNSSGNVESVLSISQDITERRRLENDYQLLFNQMLDGLAVHEIICDDNGKPVDYRYQAVNPAFERMTGLRAADIVGKTVLNVFPDTEKYWIEAFRQVALTGNPARFENYSREMQKYFMVQAFQPAPNHFACIVEDITAVKKSEKERDQLILAIEQSAEAMVMTDARGIIEYVNPAFEKITGYNKEEAVGQNPRILKSGNHPPEFYRELWSTISQGSPWNGRFVNKKRNGALYTEEAVISPVRDLNGKIINYVAVKRDISEEIKLQEQLLHAQKMESVGRLAGGVAHDFNNMLAVILGHSEMALEQTDPAEPVYTDLDEIRKAAERSSALTRQLLAFARKQTIRPKILTLNKIVNGMLKMLNRLIGESIELIWLPGKNLWPVKIDPTQVDQILANLCVNAKDAINDIGKIIIRTENATLTDKDCLKHSWMIPGDYVLLSLTDDGCGMETEILNNLFEPFFTTKGVGEGTGLGLATVYGIVKQNNGFIDVSSRPGKGTHVKIYMPRQRVAPVNPGKDKTRKVDARGKETILLVEDELATLRMVKMMLGRLGYTVLAAEKPSKAIDAALSHCESIDLLITDLVMPQMNGRELADKIKTHFPEIQTLFMSGYSTNLISKQEIIEEGIFLIDKPFTKNALAEKVRKVLASPQCSIGKRKGVV